MMCSMNATAKTLLCDLAAVSAGHPVRGAVHDLAIGSVIMLQMRDVDEQEGIAWEDAVRIEPPGKRTPNFLEPGDVLFTSRGAKNLAVAVRETPGSAICAPNLFIVRLYEQSACLPAYLAWYMNQRPAQLYFQRSATGTNILNIRREVVEQLLIPVPSLAEQHAIVGFADAARTERNLLRGLIRNRDQQLEALALGLAGSEGA